MTAIEELKTVFAGQFMRPQCYVGADIQEALMREGLDVEDDGFYCRLSAPGYMDCTDFSGPFATMEEAAQHLIDTYGDD